MKRKKKGEFTYEDFSDIIDAAIKRQQYKWRLKAVRWFDFQDVEQIIKLHIAKKWHMWDQERPLEPWIGRIISNQMRNLIRNHCKRRRLLRDNDEKTRRHLQALR